MENQLVSAVFLDALACLRVKLDNVADRSIRAQKLPQRRLRVNLRDFRESRVARLAGCPPEQGKVHHAVDDGKSALVRVIPRADEPRRVEAPHEKPSPQRCDAKNKAMAKYSSPSGAGP